MMKLIVFIDIDGTILYDPEGEDFPDELDGQRVCDGLERFLEYTLQHCEPYWLSYRARLGKRDILESRILPYLPDIARHVPIAYWDDFKHEGLTTERPFLWFDDYLEPEDAHWLRQNNLRDSLVRVESTQKDNPLLMLEALRQRLSL